jgi:hypothetical protein
MSDPKIISAERGEGRVVGDFSLFTPNADKSDERLLFSLVEMENNVSLLVPYEYELTAAV